MVRIFQGLSVWLTVYALVMLLMSDNAQAARRSIFSMFRQSIGFNFWWPTSQGDCGYPTCIV